MNADSPPRVGLPRRPGIAALALVAVGLSGCTLRQLAAPAGASPLPLGEARAALERLGPRLRPDHLEEAGILEFAADTVYRGVQSWRLLQESSAEDRVILDRRTRRLYACADHVLEVGRVTVDRRAANGTGVRYSTAWRGEWVPRTPGGWGLRRGRIGGGVTLRSRVPADCVTAAEQGLAGRDRAVVLRAPVHPLSTGGPMASASAELELAGWGGLGCAADECGGATYPDERDRAPLAMAYRQRVRGAWGAELAAGLGGGRVVGYDPTAGGEARVDVDVGYLAVQAAYEIRYLRAAAGPALVATRWAWDTPAPGSDRGSSSWGLGWLNQASFMLPVTGALYADVTVQDRLFGRSPLPLTTAAPESADVRRDQRLSGTVLVLGLGVKF